MINVTAAITVRPGQGPAFEEAVAKARAQVLENPGCLRYDLQRLRRSEDDYLMLEAWESPAALKEHGASEAFAELGKALAGLVSSPPKVSVYEPVGDQVGLG